MTDSDMTATDIVAMIRKQKSMAMMATLDDAGIVARPMDMQACDDDGTLWFIAEADSDKCQQLRADKRILVSFASGDFLSISGTAEVLTDAAKAAELWDPSVAAWMQCEPSDPKVALIKVTPDSVGYWETAGAVGAVAGMLKGLITKQRPSGGDSGVVEMSDGH